MITIQALNPNGSAHLLIDKLNEPALTEQQFARNVLVSWGVQLAHQSNYIVLNGMPSVNGLRQLHLFQEAHVEHPKFTASFDEAMEWIRQDKLVFGRTLQHTQGRDIVDHRHRQFRHRDYYTQVIPDVAQEWRIHVVWGKSIARGVKHQVAGTGWRRIHRYRRDLPIRNRAFGWRMRHGIDPPRGIRDVSKKAVAAIGYDFGAVDILQRSNGEFIVLEVNKMPGLDEYTATQYANAFTRIAKGEWQPPLQQPRD